VGTVEYKSTAANREIKLILLGSIVSSNSTEFIFDRLNSGKQRILIFLLSRLIIMKKE